MSLVMTPLQIARNAFEYQMWFHDATFTEDDFGDFMIDLRNDCDDATPRGDDLLPWDADYDAIAECAVYYGLLPAA
jgi:hypothetical protein